MGNYVELKVAVENKFLQFYLNIPQSSIGSGKLLVSDDLWGRRGSKE